MTNIRTYARRFQLALALVLCSALSVGAAQAAETVTYYHTDALGTPVMESNAAGTVTYAREHKPYGEQALGAAKNGPGFTGHVGDADTGLTYMQARYFDPIASRFLSNDPVAADMRAGGNYNRYWYANNNPYRFTDPDGRKPNDNKKPEEVPPVTPPPPPPPPPPPVATTGSPPPTPAQPAITTRTVSTVTGQTQDEAAKAAQRRIMGLLRRGQKEYCGQVCPDQQGGYQVVITTNDAASACVPQRTCDGPDLHNHPVGAVTLTPGDAAISGGQRPAGSIFVPATTYSDHEAGYLIIGPSLYHRETPSSTTRGVE